MEIKESIRNLMKRVSCMNMLFTEEYVKELENLEKEKELVEKAKKSEEPTCVVMTADWNAKVDLDCMKECTKIFQYLNGHADDIEEWVIAGINAMMDKVNEMKELPYDLPTVIYKMLTYADK